MAHSSSHLTPVAIGLIMVGFGINQLIHSKKWTGYIPKPLTVVSPVEPEVIIKAHGSGNFLLGLAYILFNGNKAVQWIVSGWWLNVMILCGLHSWKEGARDMPIFLTTLALALNDKKHD